MRKKLCRMSQHCKSGQTESACVAVSKCMSRDQSVDLTGVLSCRSTLVECLRHNHLSLRQVSSM